ncbi:hypothetical protein L1049_008871 [Liquidambar formosana]|uniref:Sulfotransferase n=1 Tax=Liquidambar formosana TaxID=63359 RepID=A0AAP0S4Y6_LIQFO
MEKADFFKSSFSIGEEEKGDEFQELLLALPQQRNRNGSTSLYLYQGFWCPSEATLKAIISFQRHFQAQETDLILASSPKSGTTWLKALAFMIVNRARCALNESPLLTTSPQELVPTIEFDLYMRSQCPNLEDLPCPRILSTHIPFASLPGSIKDSKCRIVYVCRNPFDQFVSYWHFLLHLPHENVEPLSLDESFELFCKGVHAFGPFWDHVSGFWKASLERPDKVLFFKYEDMKADIIFHIKRLAEFLGLPFSEEEGKKGVIEEISRLCSFETLKDLEVNKYGKQVYGTPNSAFFRKGKVGDWANHLTPAMAECLKKLIEGKFGASGLTFEMSC